MRKIYTLLMLLASISMSAQQINGDLNENKKVDIEDVTMLIDDYLNDKPHYLSASPANPFTVDNSLIMGTWYAADKSALVFGEDGYVTMNGTRYQYKFVPAHGRLLMFNENGKFVYCNDVYMLEDDYLLIESKSGSVEYTRTMPIVHVSSITLSATTLTLKPGESLKLTATVLPANATIPGVVWISSNEDVAAVLKGTVVAMGYGTAIITATAAEGSGINAECVVTVKDGPNTNGHEYVDLGLPSGTLWATCNIGATSPEEYGDYFAWGETEPKSTYSWSTYKWCNGSYDTQTKYCTSSSYGTVDNKTILDPEDDAAHVNWGGDWRMPTYEEQTELRSKCTWSWTTMNGVYGCKVVGPNGNSIFLPAAGYRGGSLLITAGSYGDYWSSSLLTLYSNDAYYLYFFSGDVFWNYFYRYFGLSVRPVCQ